MTRVEVLGNGKLDISSHNAPGVSLGSIEGTGNVFLGANSLTVGSTNRSTTFSGAMQDGGVSGSTGGSLTKIGTGTLTLSGANTYTGGTTITGGLLIIGASDALPSSGAITLNGGTLVGKFSNSFGALTIGAAGGTIDFGGSGSSLAFADSSAATWLGGSLTILNYATGDSLRFGSSSSALTSAQLGLINFGGSNPSGALLSDSGYVLPTGAAIPEPSTCAVIFGFAALGCAVWRRQRRHSV